MIAAEKRPTSFGHDTNLLDAYSTQERLMLKLTPAPQFNNAKNKAEDDELGIFGAEKYFTGAIGEPLQTTSNNMGDHYRSNRLQEKHGQPCPAPKPKTASATPSVRSESSWNSQRGLLASNGNDHRKRSCVKSLLASLGCNCNDKASVKITDNKVHVKEATKQPVKASGLAPKEKSLPSRWADADVVLGKKFVFNDVNNTREDCFTFPVLNASTADNKCPDLSEAEREGNNSYGRTRQNSSQGFGSPVLEKGKKSFSLERKLTMLNWDGVTPRAEIIDISRNGGHNDTGSDASSDLFEIESFSTNENNLFLARQALDNNESRPSNANGYAPSEASVDWSVITASAAEDLTESQTVKPGADMERVKGSMILSGCKNLKAVRVSGDEHCMTGGGEKATVVVGPIRREWCQRLDSVTPIAKIQADTKLIGVGSDSHRGQTGFGTARSIPRTHSTNVSHPLYIQQ